MINRTSFPALPHSWSELTWQQLCDCWQVKVCYGGNADVARAAAVLALCGCSVCPRDTTTYSTETGETVYTLADGDGSLWLVTPRDLSQMAIQALPWFDYPYGDPGKEAVRDEKGKVIEEAVDPVRGYVSQMRDAMILPEQELEVDGVLFALPQMACNNLTWQQYRSLQALAPMLFQEGMSDGDVLELQAEFLSHILVPARENTAAGDRFAPKHDFTYNTERAEQTVVFWKKKLAASLDSRNDAITEYRKNGKAAKRQEAAVLFHICFQCYQTALTYYAGAYPLLFSDGDKKDQMKDALQGEVGTINTIMKYAGYAEQQQVYDSNLPFVLDILNTMAKEAKEIEAMNARIKHK